MLVSFDVIARISIAIGTIFIAIGVVESAVKLRKGYAEYKKGGPGARRNALQDLHFPLFFIAIGVNILASISKNLTAVWVAVATLAAIMLWNLRSLLKSRTRREPDHPTGEPS